MAGRLKFELRGAALGALMLLVAGCTDADDLSATSTLHAEVQLAGARGASYTVVELDENLSQGDQIFAGELDESGEAEADIDTSAPALDFVFTLPSGDAATVIIPVDNENDDFYVTPAAYLATRIAEQLVARGAMPLAALDEGYHEVQTAMGLAGIPLSLYAIGPDSSDAWARESALQPLATQLGTEVITLVDALADDYRDDQSFNGLDGNGNPIPLAGATLPPSEWSDLATYGPSLPAPLTTIAPQLFDFAIQPLPFAVSGAPVQVSWYAAAREADSYEIDVVPDGSECQDPGAVAYTVSGTTLSYTLPPFAANTTLVCLKAFLGNDERDALYSITVPLRN